MSQSPAGAGPAQPLLCVRDEARSSRICHSWCPCLVGGKKNQQETHHFSGVPKKQHTAPLTQQWWSGASKAARGSHRAHAAKYHCDMKYGAPQHNLMLLKLIFVIVPCWFSGDFCSLEIGSLFCPGDEKAKWRKSNFNRGLINLPFWGGPLTEMCLGGSMPFQHSVENGRLVGRQGRRQTELFRATVLHMRVHQGGNN